MSDYIHCPNCDDRLHPFGKVNQAEAAHINEELEVRDGHGWWRCENRTPEGRCLWVQPRWHQAKGFSLPESFR
ncbi:hypothetical protein [Streptomyces griseomycini]|uniref:Uncharacterized protein n=1 Tax=Streptomyces griseomycini TaxID=66895 RepID=A0A7W7PQH0_9ACTN|nr:hypothetical protein [Streptomyces griseomycini]MBB4896840.1 hypothetical protein [Streptomyces griseomycini]GGP86935.1 hypothetical protein GCM10010266_07110 [Streptomyces griseomycini]GGR15007.1 hypothetical protein GCM10015536_20700 [Streptomyces griseomycini]